jgi:uncharacterized secreted repeat protein (TIGR03808 family)
LLNLFGGSGLRCDSCLIQTMKLSRRALIAAMPLLVAGIGSARAFTLSAKSGDQTVDVQAAIDGAIAHDGTIVLGPGTFKVGTLNIAGDVQIVGTPGQTVLKSAAGETILAIAKSRTVALNGISFATKGVKGELVTAENVQRLLVQDCSFAGGGTGLRLQACGGRITGSIFKYQQSTGFFSMDATGLEISGNTVSDIGNNGILVWRSELGEDGSIISNNHVARIAAEDGGTGQNGNGIGLYRAGNVIVSNNRISDCAYSGIRDNSGSNVVISGNNISRTNEVALYVEFAFQGASVTGNVIEDSAFGISVTNLDVGGRLAVVDGNLLRRIRGSNLHGGVEGVGIGVEADTVVSNNVIEDVSFVGLHLGWGDKGRNISAIGNILRNCGYGISVSVANGFGDTVIANNVIDGSKKLAIAGFTWDKLVTGDLADNSAKVPKMVKLSNNTIRN